MRIALATCERPDERDTDFDYLAPALRRRGAEAVAAVWTDDAVEWRDFDLVLVNSTWDYHTQLERFRDWLRAVAAVTRLRNELETLEWNLDKRYLRGLEAAGLPIVPTLWTEPGAAAAVERAVAARGWGDVIIKPVVDLGAKRLARGGPEMVAPILERLDEPGMAQPFLPSIESEGEISVLFVGGQPLHAVRKRPVPGDFRVQPEYGGTHERIEPPAEAVRIGRAALAQAPGEPLYARVDLVAGPDRRLRLIELELIEPHFYLDAAPAGAETLARELLAAAS